MPNIDTKTISSVPIRGMVHYKPRSFAKRFCIGLIKIVLYVGFVAAAIYFTPKILASTLHTQYPLATITSGSMWPVLKTNDLILMKGMSGKDAHIGQIVVYENGKGFTIHRLVRKEGNKLVTRGDANDIDDAPITPEQIVGRAVYIGSSPFRIPMLGIIARDLGPKIQTIEKQNF